MARTETHDSVDDIVADDPETFARSEVEAEQTDEAVLADAYGDQPATEDRVERDA